MGSEIRARAKGGREMIVVELVERRETRREEGSGRRVGGGLIVNYVCSRICGQVRMGWAVLNYQCKKWKGGWILPHLTF
jgi:hypothetical protein